MPWPGGRGRNRFGGQHLPLLCRGLLEVKLRKKFREERAAAVWSRLLSQPRGRVTLGEVAPQEGSQEEVPQACGGVLGGGVEGHGCCPG